ncbi:MAG: hypothetical protein HRU06_14830 [Oceanospirillaceae bacterium]|nr:hypothetical protein [Oceanospirillaceae bacterium]
MRYTLEDCFHEMCHFWFMYDYFGEKEAIAYCDGRKLTINTAPPPFNNYEELVDLGMYMVAGIAGDSINGQFGSDDNIYNQFCTDPGYGDDLYHFRRIHKASTRHYNIKDSLEKWFDLIFDKVTSYLLKLDIDELHKGAALFLKNGTYHIPKGE